MAAAAAVALACSLAILSDLRGCASLSDLLGATGAGVLWLEAELGVGAVDVGAAGIDDLALNGMNGASSTSRTLDPCRGDDDDDAGFLVLVGVRVRVQVTDLEDLPTE